MGKRVRSVMSILLAMIMFATTVSVDVFADDDIIVVGGDSSDLSADADGSDTEVEAPKLVAPLDRESPTYKLEIKEVNEEMMKTDVDKDGKETVISYIDKADSKYVQGNVFPDFLDEDKKWNNEAVTHRNENGVVTHTDYVFMNTEPSEDIYILFSNAVVFGEDETSTDKNGKHPKKYYDLVVYPFCVTAPAMVKGHRMRESKNFEPEESLEFGANVGYGVTLPNYRSDDEDSEEGSGWKTHSTYSTSDSAENPQHLKYAGYKLVVCEHTDGIHPGKSVRWVGKVGFTDMDDTEFWAIPNSCVSSTRAVAFKNKRHPSSHQIMKSKYTGENLQEVNVNSKPNPEIDGGASGDRIFFQGMNNFAESFKCEPGYTRFFGERENDNSNKWEKRNWHCFISEMDIPGYDGNNRESDPDLSFEQRGVTIFYGRQLYSWGSTLAFNSFITDFDQDFRLLIDPNGGTWGERYNEDGTVNAKITKDYFGYDRKSAYTGWTDATLPVPDAERRPDGTNYWDFSGWTKSDPFVGAFDTTSNQKEHKYTFKQTYPELSPDTGEEKEEKEEERNEEEPDTFKDDKITANWKNEPILGKVRVVDKIDDPADPRDGEVLTDKTYPIKEFPVGGFVKGIEWGGNTSPDSYHDGYHLINGANGYTQVDVVAPVYDAENKKLITDPNTTFSRDNEGENAHAVAGQRLAPDFAPDSVNVIDGKKWNTDEYWDYTVYRYFEANHYTLWCYDYTTTGKLIGITPVNEKDANFTPNPIDDAKLNTEIDVETLWGTKTPTTKEYGGLIYDHADKKVITAQDADKDCKIIVKRYFKPGTYTITYDGNGHTGGGPIQPQKYVYLTGTHIKGNGTAPTEAGDKAFTKTGYKFVCWNTNPNAEPEDTKGSFYPGDEYGKEDGQYGDLRLYAIWKISVPEDEDEATLIVRHYQEQKDGTFKLKDTDNQRFDTSTWVTPETKTYSGFRSPARITVLVTPKPGGNTVIVNYSYYLNDSPDPDPHGGNLIVSHYKQTGVNSNNEKVYQLDERISETKYKVGDTVTPLPKDYGSDYNKPSTITVQIREGKNYVDYYYDFSDQIGPDPNKYDATLIVRHYQEQKDGTFKLKEQDQPKTYETTEWVTPATKNYDGYKAPNKVTVKVEPKRGGNTIYVNYDYYKYTERITPKGNLLISHYVQTGYDTNNKGVYELKETSEGNYEVGKTVTPPVKNYGSMYSKPSPITVKIREGKNFVDYYYDFNDGPTDKAVWVTNHYKMNNDNKYPSKPSDVDTGYGDSGKNFTFPVRTYKGFVSPKPRTQKLVKGIINIVNYYYPRDGVIPDPVNYVVEHYKQKKDLSYNSYPDETDVGLAQNGSKFTAPTKPYVGYKQPKKQTITIKKGEKNGVVYHYELGGGDDPDNPKGKFSFSGVIVKVKEGGSASWSSDSDEVKVKNPLKGAKFELEKLYNEDGTAADVKIRTIVTDSDGVLGFSKLTAGIYRLRETDAPDGYSKNKNDMYLNIVPTYDKNGDLSEYSIYKASSAEDAKELDKAIEILRSDGRNIISARPVAIENKKSGEVHVYTVDGNDRSKGLPGAEYRIVDSNNNEVGTISSDNSGYGSLRDLEHGNYTLTETKAPDGYKKLDTATQFSITEENPIRTIYILHTKDSAYPDPTIGDIKIVTEASWNKQGGNNDGGTGGQVTITDKVTYTGFGTKNTNVGYQMVGYVVDKETNAPLTNSSGAVVSSSQGFSGSGSGTLTMTFTVDRSTLKQGQQLVVFENVCTADGNSIVASHTDINDAKQTVNVDDLDDNKGEKDKKKKKPFYTEAKANGQKYITLTADTAENITITDTIELTNIGEKDAEYKMVGYIVDKATGKPIELGEKKYISAQKEFKNDGSPITMEFTVPKEILKEGMNLVVFENIVDKDGKSIGEVGKHTDVNDADQTVTVKGYTKVQTGVYPVRLCNIFSILQRFLSGKII